MKTGSLFLIRDALATDVLTAMVVIFFVPPGTAEGQPAEAAPQYQGWQHSGSIYILTTREGADLPTSTSEEGLLIRNCFSRAALYLTLRG
jgi:hypothetical protein